MKLNRRSFLKLTASIVATLTIPSIAKDKKLSSIGLPEVESLPTFDPEKQYVFVPNWDEESMEFARKELTNQIRLFLPPEFCNEKHIQFTYKSMKNEFRDLYEFRGLGQTCFGGGLIGWKYTPEAKS